MILSILKIQPSNPTLVGVVNFGQQIIFNSTNTNKE